MAQGSVRSGTGFIVSAYGFAATSAHVVIGCPAVAVWPRDGGPHPARVIAADASRDIALLQADKGFPGYPPAPSVGGRAVGESVLVLGYGVHVRDPRRPVTTLGAYLGSEATASGIRVDIIRARLLRGDSGGPVLGADGALLGMVIGRYADRPDLGVVLPVAQVERFLGEHGMAFRPRKTPAAATPRDRALAISLLVQCLSSAPDWR